MSNRDEKKATTGEELPLESSPYTKYEDLEDYKNNAYGTSGHQEVKPGRGAGGTDAPTPSGGAPPSAIDSGDQKSKK
ncbi:PREDICTED: uncharacterized protein LOC104806914 [Tarenaya hassleriana]|uniref:uncharacterized protein LOC104806914 n=1 Tax=Tarenaya hassleriana TaxID=28532 RepID=UPI00053C2EE4|nr:PREDICTED: uncharacterized protein LOC104806914 [Tarenaya hassleriana]